MALSQQEVDEALECPCVEDLKSGSCGAAFKDAFTCYAMSNDPEKGSECAKQFMAWQACLSEHPEQASNLGVEKSGGAAAEAVDGRART